MAEIDEAVQRAKSVRGKPHKIMLDTIRRHGRIPGEGVRENHSMTITKEDAEKAIEELRAREGG